MPNGSLVDASATRVAPVISSVVIRAALLLSLVTVICSPGEALTITTIWGTTPRNVHDCELSVTTAWKGVPGVPSTHRLCSAGAWEVLPGAVGLAVPKAPPHAAQAKARIASAPRWTAADNFDLGLPVILRLPVTVDAMAGFMEPPPRRC